MGCRLLQQVENIEQFAGIASAVTEQGLRLFHTHFATAEYFVVGKSAVKQGLQIGRFKWLQRINLRAGKQWPYYLKRRIFCRGTDQCHGAVFHGSEQAVLLAFAESVYFIDKKYWPSA